MLIGFDALLFSFSKFSTGDFISELRSRLLEEQQCIVDDW